MTFTSLLVRAAGTPVTQPIALDSTSGALYFGNDEGAMYAVPTAGGAATLLSLSTPNLHMLASLGAQVYAGFDTPPSPYVIKWDPTGQLAYSTLITGSCGSAGEGIAVDSAGGRVIAATYLGGSFETQASAVTLDSAGNIYLTGSSAKVLPGPLRAPINPLPSTVA